MAHQAPRRWSKHEKRVDAAVANRSHVNTSEKCCTRFARDLSVDEVDASLDRIFRDGLVRVVVAPRRGYK